jgi:chaperone required for assembly of F1-ATPase
MPLTGLANAAIDRVAPEHGAFAAGMAAYGETELLCYRAESPPDLIARQAERWDPLLDWARSRYDVDFTLVEGVMHRPQPMATVLRLGAAVAAASADQLAALSPLVTISGSLVISLALMEEAVLPGDAFDLAHLDELWQAELWGEDDWAMDARDARRRDFLAACHFLELLRA